MAKDTWASREMPILEAIFEAEESGDSEDWTVSSVAEATEFSKEKATLGVRALAEAGFIWGHDSSTTAGWDLFGIRLMERGRRAVGQWPTDDVYDTLLRTLRAQIDEESDPARKTRLTKLLDVVTSVGQDVAGSVLSAWFRQMSGLP